MQLFPLGRVYDFMGQRKLFMGVSFASALVALVAIFYPGLNLGTDFKGGTEIEVAFTSNVEAGDIRQAVTGAGFSHPDVIKIDDAKNPNRYLIRVQEVSNIGAEKQTEIERALCHGDNLPADQCGEDKIANEVKFSPGGDKITVRFRQTPSLDWVKQRMSSVGGIALRPGANNPFFQSKKDNKVEIQLMSKGDQLMGGLRDRLGPGAVPDNALRTEWIGPKAGAQLRNDALKSIAIAMVFIMAYIAFRFDVRFAPGAVIAMMHDAVTVMGFLVLTNREVNLTTVAAVLTVVGYSVNDTVVVFDRVRENLGRLRGMSFVNLINISLSEMLSRTILTGSTAVFSLLAFFIWGTGVLKDFSLTLIVGILLGVYSSIYIALPLTEWLDHTFFAGLGKRRKIGDSRKGGPKPSLSSA
jgi:preprotein translocase subunit SecF